MFSLILLFLPCFVHVFGSSLTFLIFACACSFELNNVVIFFKRIQKIRMGLKCCSFFSFEWKSEIGREKSQRKIKDEHGDFQA